MIRRVLSALGLSGASHKTASHEDLLALLDETEFFLGEDCATQDRLRADVAARGIDALWASERLVYLDAEDLAEGGIIAALEDLRPFLSARGAELREMEETVFDGETYLLTVNGTAYTAYAGPNEARDSWALASETFYRIVNDLLSACARDHFYLVNGGNDLAGFFLPPPIALRFEGKGSDCPYEPLREHPWMKCP